MVTSVTVDELGEFRTAVAGVDIDWIRRTQGYGPARMTRTGNDRLAVSTGGIDFSALLKSDVPHDRIAFQWMLEAPDGIRWNGREAGAKELRVYHPGMMVFGSVPAGSKAITLVADLNIVRQVAHDLGRGDLEIPETVAALPEAPGYRRLARSMCRVAAEPALLDNEDGLAGIAESVARSLTPSRHAERFPFARGYDSREIVARCLAHLETTGEHQPSISELCRVALVAESRLRQAFIDVLEVPPSQFLQLRLLSLLRERLLESPVDAPVTEVESSLGLTQFGRVAARYRAVFGETPSQSLRRYHALRRHEVLRRSA